MKISREKFEKIIQEEIRSIPEKFLKELTNVEICVEDNPTPFQLGKLNQRGYSLLLGLYEGIPKTKRANYAQVLPDKITLFQKPLEKVSKSEKDLRKNIRNTIWHEIAHHFGLNEEEVREAERKRREKKDNI